MSWVEIEMQQQEMEAALLKLCELLEQSEQSLHASESPDILLKKVRRAHSSVSSTGKIFNPHQLLSLLTPTSTLQETSIDNGWGSEFLEIAETIERCIEACG